jgi:hypothetical protein
MIFVVFKLMKNIIFNKTEIFVGRNTSNHACQIFCSKSNCETISFIFHPRDNRGQNNEQSECLIRPHIHGCGLNPKVKFQKQEKKIFSLSQNK